MPRVEETPLLPSQFEEMLGLSAAAFAISAQTSWPQLGRYLAELDRWRRTMNLTGSLSSQDLVDHTLESILGAPLISHGARVIDIGSGAGFPGLPLAIQRPDAKVCLTEPRSKRASFLRHIVRELDLSNVDVLGNRAQEVGGQTFEIATVRAVTDPTAWLATSPLIRQGGALLAWTTFPAMLEKGLGPDFRSEPPVWIPGSRLRQIAVFRRLGSHVPRGTSIVP